MSDSTTLEKVLEGAAALGALLAGALVGRATTAKRDVESDRAGTVLPPPPITLSNADMDALRGREAALERRADEQGARITVLEATAAKQLEQLKREMEAAATEQLNRTLRTLADRLREPAKEGPRVPRRDHRRDSDG